MTRSVPTDTPSRASATGVMRDGGSRKSAALKARRFQRGIAPSKSIPSTSKARSVGLAAEASVDDAIAVVFEACRTHWHVNVVAAVDGRDAEGIHQVRVALRRMRSALGAFKKFIPAVQRLWLKDEAKWLLTQLGPVRDLDVFIHGLVTPVANGVSDDPGLAQLMRAARIAQRQAQTEASKTLQSVRVARFMTRLETWIKGRGWRAGARKHVRDARTITAADFGSQFLNRRLRNIMDDTGDIAGLTVEERHELRIAVKKTRYNVEFFQAVLPAKRANRLNGVLKDLQDNLGHLNDIDVAERTIATLTKGSANETERRQVAAGGAAVSDWHKDAAKKAEPDLAKLWRKLKKVSAL